MNKVTEGAGHEGRHSSDSGIDFRRRNFILGRGTGVGMCTDVCKIAGIESVLPDDFHFLSEVAGKSVLGGETSGKGTEGGGCGDCREE